MQIEKFENITLYCGDCRKIMPEIESVDSIITDPVWGDNHLPEFAKINPYSLFKSAYKTFPSYKRAAYILNCDSNPLLLRPVKEPYCRTMWLRYDMPGHKGRVLNSGLVAYCFGEFPKHKKLIGGEVSAPGFQQKLKTIHPCRRRMEHINFVVYQWSEPNETVLDPFMGSGTTLLACIEYSRKAIGIEKKQEYFDEACREVESALKKKPLFSSLDTELKQDILFK